MSTISASTTTTTAFKITTDTTGALVFQTGSGPTTYMTLDATGDLGLGVTPSAWASSSQALQNQAGALFTVGTGSLRLFQNAYYNSATNNIYVNTAAASGYIQAGGAHQWFNAPSGTAGATATFTQAMTLDASGNLLVGSTGAGFAASGRGLIEVNGTSTGMYGLKANGAAMGYFACSTSVVEISTNGAYPLLFTVNGAERARIDSSGNLLVGATSLASGLSTFAQIEASGTTGGVLINSATNNIGRLIFTNNNASGNEGLIRYDGSNQSMQFWTAANERARIDSSGNLLVGITSAQGGSAGDSVGATIYGSGSGTAQGATIFVRSSANHVLYVNNKTSGGSLVQFYNGGSSVGQITSNGTTTTYGTTSDYRLKENVVPMEGALDKVSSLRPVVYTWKTNGAEGQGFIAHELQAVFSEAVAGEKDAVDDEGNPKYQSIDTSFLVATLTAAIQELNTRLEAVENK